MKGELVSMKIMLKLFNKNPLLQFYNQFERMSIDCKNIKQTDIFYCCLILMYLLAFWSVVLRFYCYEIAFLVALICNVILCFVLHTYVQYSSINNNIWILLNLNICTALLYVTTLLMQTNVCARINTSNIKEL